MAYCVSCGMNLPPGVNFCPKCGQANVLIGEPRTENIKKSPGGANRYRDLAPAEALPYDDEADIFNNKVFAVFAYLNVLILIPVFAAKGSKFAAYHINQGLLLILYYLVVAIFLGIITAVFVSISWRIYAITVILWMLYWLGGIVMIILGVVNAASGKKKPLPVVGGITLLKV